MSIHSLVWSGCSCHISSLFNLVWWWQTGSLFNWGWVSYDKQVHYSIGDGLVMTYQLNHWVGLVVSYQLEPALILEYCKVTRFRLSIEFEMRIWFILAYIICLTMITFSIQFQENSYEPHINTPSTWNSNQKYFMSVPHYTINHMIYTLPT